MKYGLFDESGFPIGFFDDAIHKQIPENAVPLSDEQWVEFITNQRKRKWNFSAKEVEHFDPETSKTLEQKKQELLTALNMIFSSLISPTDYILLKIQEARETGEDFVSLQKKYENKLKWRNNLRKWQTKKKNQILNAKNKEELTGIRFDDYPEK